MTAKGNRSGLFFSGQENVCDNVLVGVAIRYTNGRIKDNELDKQDWTTFDAGVYASIQKTVSLHSAHEPINPTELREAIG